MEKRQTSFGQVGDRADPRNRSATQRTDLDREIIERLAFGAADHRVTGCSALIAIDRDETEGRSLNVTVNRHNKTGSRTPAVSGLTRSARQAAQRGLLVGRTGELGRDFQTAQGDLHQGSVVGVIQGKVKAHSWTGHEGRGGGFRPLGFQASVEPSASS